MLSIAFHLGIHLENTFLQHTWANEWTPTTSKLRPPPHPAAASSSVYLSHLLTGRNAVKGLIQEKYDTAVSRST